MGSVNFNMISSGSRGNSTLIWDDETLLIIDFGITIKRFRERIKSLGIQHRDFSLFVSHEHSDHSRGVGMMRKHHSLDIYSRELTLEAMGITDGFGIRDSLAIGNFYVKAVSVSHDAADPVGYVIESGKSKITVISDLGQVSEGLINEAKNSDILAFEANHDIDMLKNGSYPYHLKRRILGDQGHLSNEQSAEAISSMAGPNSRIILTHLSQENNTQDSALNTVKSYLANRGINYSSIECASQTLGSALHTISID